MLIIGIAGGTGSGKTTVVQQIINELPQTEAWGYDHPGLSGGCQRPVRVRRHALRIAHHNSIGWCNSV